MRHFVLIAFVMLAASLVVPSTSVNANEAQGPNRVYFEQTGQYLGGAFLDFWREHGGIRTFGYPLTSEIEQNGKIVQYFERQVFEYYPDHPEEQRVLPRRLGAEARNVRDTGSESPFQASAEADSGIYFPITEQNLWGDFLEFWEANGGIRVFGYPLSAEFENDGTLVQYAERAVFELHPDNPDEWRVQPQLLGVDAAERAGVDTSPEQYDGETPVYQPDLWQPPEPDPAPQPAPEPEPLAKPSQLHIGKFGVASSFEHVGYTPQGAMQAPQGWFNVAWLQYGPVPGAPGNAVVAGHLDAPGGVPSTFWNLNQLVPGDRVTVIAEDGSERVFEVTGSEVFHFYNMPTQRIFGPTEQRNMNLITCAGSWDYSLGTYDHRLVVYTTLVE